MKNVNSSCTISGHEPNNLPWRKNEESSKCIFFKLLLHVRITLTILSGYDTFYTGMNLGVDLIFGEIIAELKKQKIQIKLIAVIPYEKHYKKWSTQYQQRYLNVLRECDDIIILNKEYNSNCIEQKNEYLIKHVNRLIAIYDGKRVNSKTFKAILMAKKLGREITYFNPKTMRAKTVK